MDFSVLGAKLELKLQHISPKIDIWRTLVRFKRSLPDFLAPNLSTHPWSAVTGKCHAICLLMKVALDIFFLPHFCSMRNSADGQ